MFSMDGHALLSNPLEPSEPLKAEPSMGLLAEAPNPASVPQEEDSAVTKAEKVERLLAKEQDEEAPPSKRIKLAGSDSEASSNGIKPVTDDHEGSGPTPSERQKGVAPIKAEYNSDCRLSSIYGRANVLLDFSYIHLAVDMIEWRLLLTGLQPRLMLEIMLEGKRRRKVGVRIPTASMVRRGMKRPFAKAELCLENFSQRIAGLGKDASLNMIFGSI